MGRKKNDDASLEIRSERDMICARMSEPSTVWQGPTMNGATYEWLFTYHYGTLVSECQALIDKFSLIKNLNML